MFSFILKSVIQKIHKASQCSPHSCFPSNSYQSFKSFANITSVLGESTGIEVVGGVLHALAFLTSDALTMFLQCLSQASAAPLWSCNRNSWNEDNLLTTSIARKAETKDVQCKELGLKNKDLKMWLWIFLVWFGGLGFFFLFGLVWFCCGRSDFGRKEKNPVKLTKVG